MSELTDIQKVCKALQGYYHSLGKSDEYVNEDGVGKFEAYCDDNGIEDLDDELEDNEADDCLLCDFDEDFPFNDVVENPKQFILDLIRRCNDNPEISFDFILPQINQPLFDEIEQKDIDEIKRIYKKQCPSIYNQGVEEDGGLCKLLAVQKKLFGKGYNIDYLQLLVDSYDRFRVKKSSKKQKKSPRDWAMTGSNKLFKKPLKDIKIDLPSSNGGGKGAAEYPVFASSCISSYNSRCCAKLLLNSNYKINDSMEGIVAIINAAINFIANAIQSTKSLLPFQFDICIAVGQPMDKGANPTEEVDDSDIDDESDDEEEKEAKGFVDYIGDVKKIEKKLKNNDLNYIHSKTGDEFKDGRSVQDLIQRFKKKYGVNDGEKEDYLRHNRIIGLIDRRSNNKEKPDVFLYEPPSGPYSKNIPNDAVPEWYISSARTCLLPPMKYDQEKAIAKGNIFEDDGKPDEDINIGAAFHCKGGLLTCSFHVREADVIKCYLYYNGQIIRFLPSDIKDLLPLLFNPDVFGNKDYVEKVKNGEMDKFIQEMSDKLPDKQYKAWAQKYH